MRVASGRPVFARAIMRSLLHLGRACFRKRCGARRNISKSGRRRGREELPVHGKRHGNHAGAEAPRRPHFWYNFCYTEGMKTAISLPDDVFEAADALAKERGVPRSQIYVLALRSYLEQQRGEKVMEQLNEYYANEKAVIDPKLKKLQSKALRRSEW